MHVANRLCRRRVWARKPFPEEIEKTAQESQAMSTEPKVEEGA